MFRQLVSNLPFSPTLVGQLGFYARRLKKEEVTRRAGLIVTALALVVQSLTVFTPPEAANASAPGQVGSAPRCNVDVAGNPGSAFSIANGRASVTFRVTGGANCKVQVSANSFWAPTMSGEPWNQQILHKRETQIFSNTGQKTMSVALPPQGSQAQGCFFQVDLTYGTTNVLPVLAYGHGRLSGCEQRIVSVSCDSLTIIKVDNNTYRATAKATTQNTRTTDFRFRIEGRENDKVVATSNNSASVDFNETTPGTYTVRAFVSTVDMKDITSPQCRDTFTIPQPTGPETSCVAVKAVVTNRTQVTLSGSAHTARGGTIQRYIYTVRDANGGVVRTLERATNALSDTRPVFTLPAAGNYTVELSLQTSQGNRSGGGCVAAFTIERAIEPVAECVAITATVIGRTTVSLGGSAHAENGATVSKYNFVIKNSLGQEVARTSVSSPALTATANNLTVNKPGTYTAELAVETSLGVRSGNQCSTTFTIVPPDVCHYNPQLPANSPDCQPCPGDESLWIKDPRCSSKLIYTKTAKNMTQGDVNGTSVTAKAGDRITYTLSVENLGNVSAKTTVAEVLGDVLEYAKVTHNGNGTLDTATKTISWPEETVEPGKKITHTIALQMLDTIPTTNASGSSYDCRMDNTYGNTLSIAVDCPAPKQIVEQTVEKLPSTGPTENMLFAGAVGSIVTFFYARSRQLGREVKLVRKEFNMGTI